MQNYKVFINNDLIFFEQKAKIDTASNLCSDYQIIAADELPQLIENIHSKSIGGQFCVLSFDPEKEFNNFCKKFTVLEAAGGLVLNKRNDLLMIHRFGRWDFPKGHVEKNEIISQAAIREVTEETGANNLVISQKLNCTYHMYDNHNNFVIKKTHWYLMKTDYTGSLKPQLEEDILAAVWVPNYAIQEYMDTSYPALKELVATLQQQHLLLI